MVWMHDVVGRWADDGFTTFGDERGTVLAVVSRMIVVMIAHPLIRPLHHQFTHELPNRLCSWYVAVVSSSALSIDARTSDQLSFSMIIS